MASPADNHPIENNIEHWFIFQHDLLLLIDHQIPTKAGLLDLKAHFTRQIPLGTFNGFSCYCANLHQDAPLAINMAFLPLRKAVEQLGTDWYGVITKAYSIINWDRNHAFCGRCSNTTTVHLAERFERICHVCGLAFYPRISPSVIVLIKKDHQLLMARSPHFAPGVYGLIAGFVEVGESVEEAIHREVHEEVHIQINNLRYFGSQPWPFPDSLMLGFTADYASGDIQIDGKEIEEAGWYRFDQLPGLPSTRLSIAQRLIDHFIAEQHPSTFHKEHKQHGSF